MTRKESELIRKMLLDYSNIKELLDTAWHMYIIGDETEALGIFADIRDKYPFTSYIKPQKYYGEYFPIMQVITSLSSYDHPMLIDVSEKNKQVFSLAITRCWLNSYLKNVVDTYYRAIDPLAVVIGTDYVFNFEVERLIKEVFGDNYRKASGEFRNPNIPVDYRQRFTLWPELRLLSSLSFPARKTMLCILQYVEIKSGLVDYSRLIKLSSSSIKEGVSHLKKAGLVRCDLDMPDLLLLLTENDLMKFSLDNGISSSFSKRKLAEQIAQNVDSKAIKLLLETKDIRGNFIQPLISNLPSLKKYICAEVNRLDLYFEWLVRVYSLHIPAKIYSTK